MRTRTAVLTIALALAALLPSAAVGHNPAGLACGGVRIVVFEHSNATGAWDDACLSPGLKSTDDFSFNNWSDRIDIGDTVNMNNRVSYVSVQQNAGTGTWRSVTFWHGPGATGFSWTTPCLGYTAHQHYVPNPFDNDAWSYLKVNDCF